MGKFTVKLKKYLDIIEEYVAVAAITPGMLLEYTSAGKVQAHSAAGQNAVPLIALEDELRGKGINDAFEADDPVQVWVAQRGEQANMILADGENVAIGDYLESNGDGMLKKHAEDVESFESNEPGVITVYSLQIVAQALEAIDLSGSSGAESSGALGYDKRIQVRIV